MSALAPTASPGLAITTSDPQAVPPAGGTIVPANMQLSQNPMLPAHPLGAYEDSQYAAQDALLRNQIAKQYADILQKLGYRDANGNFIQGSVETEANKQQSELARQQQLAAEGVTQDAQRNGTLFSGMRGTLQARAEDPYVRQIADLGSSTPLQLQQLYEQASGLTNDYVLGQNQLLADAASRAAANITANPPAIPGGGGAATSAAPGGPLIAPSEFNPASPAGPLNPEPTAPGAIFNPLAGLAGPGTGGQPTFDAVAAAGPMATQVAAKQQAAQALQGFGGARMLAA